MVPVVAMVRNELAFGLHLPLFFMKITPRDVGGIPFFTSGPIPLELPPEFSTFPIFDLLIWIC